MFGLKINKLNLELLGIVSNCPAGWGGGGSNFCYNLLLPVTFLIPIYSLGQKSETSDTYAYQGGVWGLQTPSLSEERVLGVFKYPPLDQFFFLLACQRGWWWTRIPLPRVWKTDQQILRKGKKKSDLLPLMRIRTTPLEDNSPPYRFWSWWVVLFCGSGPSEELSWWGIVLGIVVLVGNGWALLLSGGELSSWGVVLEPPCRCVRKKAVHKGPRHSMARGIPRQAIN